MFVVMTKGVRMVKLNASGKVVPSKIDDALTVSTGDTQGAGESALPVLVCDTNDDALSK